MTTRVIDLFLDPGDHASRPASGTVPVGSLYPCTDHGIERNDADGSWPLWDPASDGLDQAAIVALVNDDTTPSSLRTALDALYSGGGGGGGSAQQVDDSFPSFNNSTQWSSGTRPSCGTAFLASRSGTITRLAVKHKPTAGRTYRFAVWTYTTATHTLGTEVGAVDTVAPVTDNVSAVMMSSDLMSAPIVAGTVYLLTVTDTAGNNVGLGYRTAEQRWDGWLGHTLAGGDSFVYSATVAAPGGVMTPASSAEIFWRILGELA